MASDRFTFAFFSRTSFTMNGPAAFTSDGFAVTKRTPFSICAWILLLAGIGLFQFWGNATRGYINTRSLFYWWGYQWFDPASDASQGPLIILVALVLLIWNWRRFPSAYPQKQDAGGFLILVLALGLHALGYATEQTRLSICAWLLFVAGCLHVGAGLRGWRAGFFPLGFTLLAIPVGFLQPWGFSLRLAITETVEVAMRLLHHPLVRNGTQLFSPDGHYEYDVAAACSGVRSLVALFALGVVLAYLRLTSGRRRIALVALVMPFAFIGNLLRILAIIGASQFFNSAIGEKVHAWSGFLVFAVVFGLLWQTVEWMERTSFARRKDGANRANLSASAKKNPSAIETVSPLPADVLSNAESRNPARKNLFAPTAFVLFVMIALAFGARALDRLPSQVKAGIRLAPDGVNPAPLPEFIGTDWIGQRIDVTDIERSVLPPDTGYSRKNYVSIFDRAQQVFVSVVLSGRDRTSIHRPELCLVGQGWVIEKSEPTTLALKDGRTLPATLLHIRHDVWEVDGQRQVLRSLFAYYFVGEDGVVPTHAGMLWENSLGRLRHLRGQRWAYIVVQTMLAEDESRARQRMVEVLTPAWKSLRE